MINIFKRINIHFLFYTLALICAITGYFKDFIYIFLLIFFHEIGHALVASLYGWNIEKIKILPFGGITIFKENLNKPIKEEFIILISGSLFQIIFYIIIKSHVTRTDILEFYNYSLLMFNFIPLIPLDGGKLINLLLNKFTSFKKSHIITVYISYICIFIFLYKILFKFNLILIIIISFIVLNILKEHKIHNLIFNKFLLERRLYNFKFKKTKKIFGCKFEKMKRDYSHLFYTENKIYTEKEILRKKFDFEDNM